MNSPAKQTSPAPAGATPPPASQEPANAQALHSALAEMKRPALRPLAPKDIGLREFKTRCHAITLRADQPFDLVSTDPSFWQNCSEILRQGDVVDVHSADGSFFAQFYIRDVGGGPGGKSAHSARVGIIQFVSFDAIESKARALTYAVKFLGPNDGWGIVRISDQKVIVDNLPDREQAETRLRGMAA
jgi:hypothetical protein